MDIGWKWKYGGFPEFTHKKAKAKPLCLPGITSYQHIVDFKHKIEDKRTANGAGWSVLLH
jgi:hypothetical protein